jgi:hypothetical protein
LLVNEPREPTFSDAVLAGYQDAGVNRTGEHGVFAYLAYRRARTDQRRNDFTGLV